MIQELRPRYNSKDKNPSRGVYVKLTLDERFPRLSIVQTRRAGDQCVYLGPLPSKRLATDVVDAIQSVVPLRRCTVRPERVERDGACAPAQLGVSTCPCAGLVSADEYAAIAARAADAMTHDPAPVLDALAEKMRACAKQGRFEDAAIVRNRASALVRAVERQRRIDALLAAGRLEVEVDGGGAIVDGGVLVAAWPRGAAAPPPELGLWPTSEGRFVSKETAAEILCIASFVERRSTAVRVVSFDGVFDWPRGRLASFEPRRRTPARSSPAA
jgi:DNA polymerase-3 subunit epsilon